MLGLLELNITMLCYRHESVQLAMAAARQAQHCRRMKRAWRALDQPERATHDKAQVSDLERRVLELHDLAQQVPA